VTDDRWQLAYQIYEAAAALAEPEWRQYVDAAAPDREIADKVLAMLAEMETITHSVVPPGSEYSTGTDPGAASRFSGLPKGAALGRFVINGFVGLLNLHCPLHFRAVGNSSRMASTSSSFPHRR
jgi:hypothetical protein